jgi:hypothetical protein
MVLFSAVERLRMKDERIRQRVGRCCFLSCHYSRWVELAGGSGLDCLLSKEECRKFRLSI